MTLPSQLLKIKLKALKQVLCLTKDKIMENLKEHIIDDVYKENRQFSFLIAENGFDKIRFNARVRLKPMVRRVSAN